MTALDAAWFVGSGCCTDSQRLYGFLYASQRHDPMMVSMRRRRSGAIRARAWVTLIVLVALPAGAAQEAWIYGSSAQSFRRFEPSGTRLMPDYGGAGPGLEDGAVFGGEIDALLDPTPVRFYQVLAACGPDGLQEGPP